MILGSIILLIGCGAVPIPKRVIIPVNDRGSHLNNKDYTKALSDSLIEIYKEIGQDDKCSYSIDYRSIVTNTSPHYYYQYTQNSRKKILIGNYFKQKFPNECMHVIDKFNSRMERVFDYNIRAYIKEKKTLKEKEKINKLETVKIKKDLIAKYMELNPDNDTIFDLLIKHEGYLKKDIYQTEAENNKRFLELKKKNFGRKFIFDVKPEYKSYTPASKQIYIPFKGSITLAKKLEKGWSDYVGMKGYKKLTTNIPNNTEQVIKEKHMAYILLAENVTPEKAKKIHENLMLRLVVNINYEGKMKFGPGNLKFGTTYVMIAYNKSTKEIYKIFY